MDRKLDEIFPKRLKEIRNIRGLSTTQLADMIGKGQQFISKLEIGINNGGARPSIQTIEDLANALGVRMAFFFEDDMLTGDQMPMDVLLKNYDNDIREFLEQKISYSLLNLARLAVEAQLTEDELKTMIGILKRQK